MRISDWSSDVCSSDLHDYLTAITSNLGNAADWENVRQTIGLTDKPEVSPQSVYDMSEETLGGYARLDFGTSGAIPIDGNIGVLVIKTKFGRASCRARVCQYV